MVNPKFSAIIAVFNGGKTLARAIDSVLNQSAPAYELIIVDDGSTDNTAETAKSYSHPRITYLKQKNAGVSSARNLGARIATGDWLSFLDADDWYFPDRLKQHSDWIAEEPELDLLTADFQYINSQGKLLGHSLKETSAGRYLLKRNPQSSRLILDSRALELFVSQHFGDTHTLSVKKSLFESVGGYDCHFNVCEDVSLLIRLCNKAYKVGAVNQALAAYYIHPSSATRKDPLNSQKQSVAALLELSRSNEQLKPEIKAGIRMALRNAYMDLAVCQLKQRCHITAIFSGFSSFSNNPGSHTLRDLVSITVSAVGDKYGKN